MASIKIEGFNDVNNALRLLYEKELPTAYRNAINDTGRDVIRRLEREIKSVFHRPVPKVQRPIFLEEKATKEKLSAKIDFKNTRGSGLISRVVTQHVPGYENARGQKPFEQQLARRGFIGPDQYLVPSRTVKRNTYGNVTPGTYAKILNDLAVFSDISGFKSTTSRSKRRYIFATIRPGGRSTGRGRWSRAQGITGIWDKTRLRADGSIKRNALVFLVVNKRPQYAPRLRVHAVADLYGRKVFKKHMQLAIEHALSRRMRA